MIYSQSTLLPFIRQVMNNNECAKGIQKNVAWARSWDCFKIPNTEKTIKFILENNKTGKEISSEGLIALAFLFLRYQRSPALSQLGFDIIQWFLKERSNQFVPGIVRNLSDTMITEPNKSKIVECFTNICLKYPLAVAQSESTMETLMEDLLNVNEESAMNVMTIISPLIKVCYLLRQKFSEILRKAFYQR